MSEVGIAKLRRQRAIIKAACTHISNFTDTCTDITPQLVIQLEARINSLSKYWQDYDQVQSQMEDLDEENESSDRPAFETAFYELYARIKHKIDRAGQQQRRVYTSIVQSSPLSNNRFTVQCEAAETQSSHVFWKIRRLVSLSRFV